MKIYRVKNLDRGFPGGPVVKTRTSKAGIVGSIPGWGTEILQAVQHNQKKKKKKEEKRGERGKGGI